MIGMAMESVTYLPGRERCGMLVHGIGRKKRRMNVGVAVCVWRSIGSDFGTANTILSKCLLRNVRKKWDGNETYSAILLKVIQEREWRQNVTVWFGATESAPSLQGEDFLCQGSVWRRTFEGIKVIQEREWKGMGRVITSLWIGNGIIKHWNSIHAIIPIEMHIIAWKLDQWNHVP